MHTKLLRLLSFAALAMPAIALADTKPCRVPNFPQEVRCGQIQRPLDPSKPDGKKIDVHYVVLPSQDRNKLPDAVFLLAGGPGQSAIAAAGFGEAVLGKLNRRRDLVFVDQRGTGKSAPLKCPDLESADKILDQAGMLRVVHACQVALQKLAYGDLEFFTTSIAVQDLEAVRKVQNYGSINLVGASYGTRVGLEYLRQFPQSVRRLVIDGVVPPDLNLLASDAKPALEGIFADCEQTERCRNAYPGLAETWKSLLSHTPRQFSMTHPRLGHTLSATLQKEDLVGMAFKALYSPVNTSVLPYAIVQAEKGKLDPLLALSGSFSQPGPGSLTMGMHYSVWCTEAYAKPRSSTPTPDEFAAVMGDMYDKICATWPRGKVPSEFFTIPETQSPVLLLSGGIDPVTPTRNGELVAKALGKKARHVSIQNAGHGLLMHGCVRELVDKFIAAKTDVEAQAIDSSCVRQIPRPLVWLPALPMPAKAASSEINKAGE
ncbi:alpha/beta fold hydrolase [Undibacterium fentianense]|uniref:Alpha/beta hydrolase n=1 Tax=Undibacterium fentianense TaxID=2828728 RepID=A0A941ID83_9BURK|nr:alpha/beta hydrolase [Undibacterium fentianense]MBR7801034.1 alpha/beta hydrolase [Undibacterium fentianense]